MFRPATRSVGGAVLASLAVACSGASFDGRIYRGKGFSFRIDPVPPSWVRIDAPDAALAFRDEAHGSTVLLQARCGLDGDDVPLAALTQHLFLLFTERHIELESLVPFDGREAMHTVLGAKLDGVPLRYDVWVVKKDGCVYDLVYFAPAGGFEAGRPAFQQLVQSFTTVVPDG
jgi:hypothetical protein